MIVYVKLFVVGACLVILPTLRSRDHVFSSHVLFDLVEWFDLAAGKGNLVLSTLAGAENGKRKNAHEYLREGDTLHDTNPLALLVIFFHIGKNQLELERKTLII